MLLFKNHLRQANLIQNYFMNRMRVAQFTCCLYISEINFEQSNNNTKYAPIVTS